MPALQAEMTGCHQFLNETLLHYPKFDSRSYFVLVFSRWTIQNLHSIAFGKNVAIHGRFRPVLEFFTLGGLFEPENENPLVKWAEKFFSKFYCELEDCGTWVTIGFLSHLSN